VGRNDIREDGGLTHTIIGMQAWSFSLGRWMGVEVRLHAYFLLLLALTMGAAPAAGADGTRGFGLWLMLLLAVAIREVARAMAAAWMGIELNALLLLPTGGLMTFANGAELRPEAEWRLAMVGPITNVAAAIVLVGLMLAVAPGIALWEQPWIGVGHLLRALVWSNALLGVLHLLPAVPLDGGRVLRAEIAKRRGMAVAAKTAAGLSRLVALPLVFGGLAMRAPWMTAAGAFLLLAGSLDRQTVLVENEIDSIRMRDVMLEDFNTLSGADTLEEALNRALHATQDVFPVVRSGSLVGAVSRQGIVEALESGGNGYVQGMMTRGLTTAGPDDPVMTTLRKMVGQGGAQLVPVVEGDRVVGIVTPGNLSHSTRLLARQRRLKKVIGR